MAEKQLGNEAYKKKDFATAITHYTKAAELDPTEMTFLANLAAVKFEQKEYSECVDICQKAVDVGRENRADFKVSEWLLAHCVSNTNAIAEAKLQGHW